MHNNKTFNYFVIGATLKDNNIDLVWSKNPEYIRRFHKNKQLYSLLCQEVEFILTKSLEETDTEVSSIVSRVKSEASFCEKIIRKNYDDPFKEITDFSGARVVFLYSMDRKQIEQTVEGEFVIVERVDKVQGAEVDKFGYGALHYLVKLKPEYLKARYKELENLVCEIQVRTILQDAWAVVAHHLSYKQESDVPIHLRRKLNALSGLFETADDQFESIRTLRSAYHEVVTNEIMDPESEILKSEFELDSLVAYLDWRFPDRRKSKRASAELLDEVKEFGYRTLKDLDNAIERSIDAVLAYENKYPPSISGFEDFDEHFDEESFGQAFAQVGMVRMALDFTDSKYRQRNNSDRNDLSTAESRKMQFFELVKA